MTSAVTMSCPHCEAPIGPQQSWCLNCGAAARTRLVPTPNWRAPVALAAILIVLAVGALIVALVSLTSDSSSGPATSTTPAVTAPAVDAP